MCQYQNVQFPVTGPVFQKLLLIDAFYFHMDIYSWAIKKFTLLSACRVISYIRWVFWNIRDVRGWLILCSFLLAYRHVYMHTSTWAQTYTYICTHICVSTNLCIYLSLCIIDRYINTDAEHVYTCIYMVTSLCMYI